MQRHRITGIGQWVAALACCWPVVAMGEQTWTVSGGTTSVAFNTGLLGEHGIGVVVSDQSAVYDDVASAYLPIHTDSTLQVRASGGLLTGLGAGEIMHDADVTFVTPAGDVVISGFAVRNGSEKEGSMILVIAPAGGGKSEPLMILSETKMVFDAAGGALMIEAGEVIATQALADLLGDAALAGRVIAELAVETEMITFAQADTPDLAPSVPAEGDDSGVLRGTTCFDTTGPDVIVGVLVGTANTTAEEVPVGSGTYIDAFGIGTTSCNIGSAELQWQSSNPNHPVIGENFFKLVNGRFEQLGQAWLKHGFTALQNNACGCGCTSSGTGSRLGVGCSDPYGAGLNFGQSSAGPKWQVDANSGAFTYPPANPTWSGNIARRMQIPLSEIIASSTPGAPLYFAEGHYVTPDDAAAGNQDNNASYIRATATASGANNFDFALTGSTQLEEAGIRAWKDNDASVEEVDVPVSGEGLFIMAAKVTDIGGGFYHYEYAVQNLNSDRSADGFSVALPSGVTVVNQGFHDVPYHTGDGEGNVNRDGTDWAMAWAPGGAATWTMANVPGTNDNALRWGTMYNFRFDADSAEGPVTVTLDLYKAGSPGSVTATIAGPAGPPPVCGDGIVEGGEECDPPGAGCDASCQWICGDGVAHPPAEPCDSGGVNTAGCDSDCTSVSCGDGHLNTAAGETCDTGGESATCDDDCTAPSCGDGNANQAAGEFCDPPNGTTCSATCQRIPRCGDSILDAGEQCDDGNNTSGDGCSAICQSESIDLCANALPACPGSYNGSTATATLDGSTTCGSSSSTRDVWYRYRPASNGTVTVDTCAGASYDTVVSIHSACPGTSANSLVCDDDACGQLRSRVTRAVTANTNYYIRVSGFNGANGTFTLTVAGPACAAVCGNSVVETGETCDDGNTTSGDGCSATCQTEGAICGNGIVQPPEECDDANAVNTDACVNCQNAECGDGFIRAGVEQCDDGNASNTDACVNCHNAFCGDGFIRAGVEACDDGNTNSGDGCSATCQVEAPVCGNNIVEAGEQCDDGNVISGDGCNSTCQFEVSGDECETCFPAGEGTYNGSTADATDGGDDTPDCAGTNDSIDEWFCYTASCSGQAVATTCHAGTNFDTSLAAYDACGTTSYIVCNDDTPGSLPECQLPSGSFYKSTIAWTVTDGTTYYVRIAGFGGATGSYELSIACTPTCGNGIDDDGEECDDGGETPRCDGDCTEVFCGDGYLNVSAGEACDDGNGTSLDGCSNTCQIENEPTNNACANAEVVCPGTFGSNLSLATNDGSADCGASVTARDVWYSYTPGAAGTLTVRSCGTHDLGGVDTGMDTVVSVHAACPGTSGNQLVCDDDTGGTTACTGLDTGVRRDSAVSTAVSTGVTYIIRMSGFNNSAGEYIVQIDGPACDTFTDCNNNGRDDDDDIACGAGNVCFGLAGSADCNGNGEPDECDLAGGVSADCDGGPVGDAAPGQARVMALCQFCHGPQGDAMNCPGGPCPGVNIRNHSRVQIWNMLGPDGNHPGGQHPEYTQQDYADLEAYLADGGSGARPDLVPDECEALVDCDDDGESDGCELGDGTQEDLDYNGVPDGCESGACCGGSVCTVKPVWACVGFVCNVADYMPAGYVGCYGDTDGNNVVNPGDRGGVSANIGLTAFHLLCQFDLDGNGVINPGDRGIVSANIDQCAPLPDWQNGSGCNGGVCPDPRFPTGDFRGIGSACTATTCNE